MAIKLLHHAKHLGLSPRYVLFDAWYAAQKLPKTLVALSWHFVTRLRGNRYLGGKKLRKQRRYPNWGAVGTLKGHLLVTVFRRGRKFYTTSELNLDWKAVKKLYRIRAAIEETFRVLKQHCGWQAVQQRLARNYHRHLRFGMLALWYLQRLRNTHRTGIEILRRRLKLPLDQADLSAFLDLAA